MTAPSLAISSLDDLRQVVKEVLCAKESLLADQFELMEVPLVRAGQRVGLQFLLSGPRNVRLGAVWDSDKNTLFAYDARGERFAKLPLAGRPESAP